MGILDAELGKKLSAVNYAVDATSTLFLEYYDSIAKKIPSADFISKGAVKFVGGVAKPAGVVIDVAYAEEGQELGTAGVSVLGLGITSIATVVNPVLGVAVGGYILVDGQDRALEAIYGDARSSIVIDENTGKSKLQLGNVEIEVDSNARTQTATNIETGVQQQILYSETGDIISEAVWGTGSLFYGTSMDGSITAVGSDGTQIIIPAGQTPDSATQQTLDNIITNINAQTPGSASGQAQVEALNALEAASGSTESDYSTLYQANDDGAISVTDQDGNQEVYGPRTQEELAALEELGISDDGENIIAVADEDGELQDVFINNDSEVEVGGQVYNTKSLLDTLGEAADQLVNFISDQIDNAIEWFTADDGLQLDFANWFGNNINSILNGELDADEAFIDFAKYTVANRLGNQTFNIIGVDDARNAVDETLIELGLGAEEAGLVADSLQQAFQRLAIEFALSGFDFEGNQARDIAIGAVTSTVANHYAGEIFGQGTISAQASVAGVTTLAIGLANAGDFNTEDWLNLGVQVGITSASAGVGGSITAALASIGSVAPIIGTVAGALTGIFLGNIFSSLFGGDGPYYGPGEYPSAEAAIASQYQVVQVQDESGNWVDALVATNPKGSTLIAKGIRYVIGAGGDDTMVGNDLDNVMQGKGGGDYLEGKDGFDGLFGDGGDDHLVANGGDDILDTGAGNNIAFGGGGNDTIVAEDGDDQLFGDDGDDLLAAQAGDDQLFGGFGNDILAAGDGDDTAAGGSGDDAIDGGDGDDLIFGGVGHDILEGQSGNDRIYGGAGNDQIYGGTGHDVLSGGDGTNVIEAGEGNDLLFAENADDFLDGSLGDDRIHGGDGNNQVLGGFGNDFIITGTGDDIIEAGVGDDVVVSGVGADQINGGDGDDLILLSAGDKLISGGVGDDYIILEGVVANDLTIAKDEDDLVLSYGANSTRITDNDVEVLELENGTIDLQSISFDANGVASYQVDNNSLHLGQILNAKKAVIEDNIATEQSWETKHQPIEYIADESYAEAIRIEAENKFYNGPELYTIERSYDTLFGSSSYLVYKFRYNTDITGDDTASVLASLDNGTDASEFDIIHNDAKVYTSIFQHTLNSSTNARELRIYTDVWVDDEVVYSYVEVSVNPDGYSPYEVVRSEQIDPETIETVYDPTKFQDPVGLNAINRYFWRETNLDEEISMGEKILNTGSDLIVGTTVGEEIKGNSGADVLHGGEGADTISGGSDNDWIYGGVGNDLLYGGQSDDVLSGEAGDDQVEGGRGNDILYGAAGNDVLIGDDVLYAGDDILEGGKGDDILDGGLGNDILKGGSGSDTYIVGMNHGHDIIAEHANDASSVDVIMWEGGSPVFSRSGNNLIIGYRDSPNVGSVTIKDQYNPYSDSKIEEIRLIDGTLIAMPNEIVNDYNYTAGVQFYEPDPHDLEPKTINLLNHSISDIQSITKSFGDFRVALSEDDILVLSGQDSNPYIQKIIDQNGQAFDAFEYERWSFFEAAPQGTSLKDYILGSDQNNIISAKGNDDFVSGGDGDDKIYGDAGNDALYGDEGSDEVVGGDGNDILYGGSGSDELYGANGQDVLHGGLGNDLYDGGQGKDTFVISREANSIDVILYYEGRNGGEFIDISDFQDEQITFAELQADFSYEGAWLYINLPDDQVLRIYSEDSYSYITADNFIGLHTNSAPSAQNDVFLVNEDEVLIANVLTESGIDSDVDGDTLSVLAQTFETAHGGTVILQSNGSFTYNPASEFSGTDYFNYTLLDESGAQDIGTVNITVNEVDDSPLIVQNVGGSLDEDTEFVITSNMLEVSDVDNSSDELVFILTGIPVNSILKLDNNALAVNDSFTMQDVYDGSLTFAPNEDEQGAFGFTFILSDGANTTSQSMFSIVVNPVNDAPLAKDDAFEGTEDQVLNGNVLSDNGNGLDEDIDNEPLVVLAQDFTTGLGASVSLQSNGAFTYTLQQNVFGSDSFTYTLIDGHGEQSIATVTIVTPDAIDVIDGGSDNDVLLGTVGSDIINGSFGSDIIQGYEGDDELFGGDGDDFLQGGLDDDELNGGLGDDTYFYELGSDIIVDAGGDDTILFDAGITLEDLEFSNTGSENVTIIVNVPYDDIVVSEQRSADANKRIDSLMFDDGFSINFAKYENWIYASNGDVNDNTIIGDTSANTLNGYEGDDEIYGGAGADTIYGAVGNDTLHGGSGDDLVKGWDGNDVLYGGAGEDEMHGEDDDDILHGGDDNDEIYGDAGNDVLYGDDGDDSLNGGGGQDVLYGGLGADSLEGVAGDDELHGGEGDDLISGWSGADVLYGDGGNDTIYGGDGDDTIYGGAGDDTIYGEDGNDIISGAAGNDIIYGAGKIDTLRGGFGNDILDGGASDDFLYGDGGNDTLDGGTGSDELYGGSGLDDLTGGNGNDILYGEEDNDILSGGSGRDFLYGGAGADTLYGGGADSKDDRFIFEDGTAFQGIDTIKDFATGEDKIDISDVLDGYYIAGVDDITDFVSITDNGTHTTISIDQDGTGTGSSPQDIAVVENVIWASVAALMNDTLV